MKTLPIIITLFCISIIVISLSSQAYAIPYIPPSARYFNSEIVLIGKVVSSTPFSPTDTKYEIKVEQYLKNPQSQDTLTVIASGTNKSIGMTADTVFDVGQRVFLYLKQDQGNYIVWWYSYPTDFLCDPAPTAADLNSTNILGAGLDYEPLHVGASKSNSYLYAPNQPVIISYDAWNNQFATKTFDVVFQVKNQTGQIIFNDTKQVELKPCIGHQIVNSTFIPKVAGTYEADVIFDNASTGTTVEIPPAVQTYSDVASVSPLQQFRSGIEIDAISCNNGLLLVTKAEDGSPACVKRDVAYMLIKRGWATSESAYPGGDSQFALYTNSTIMPAQLPRSSGLQIPYYQPSRVINYSGFDGVYNETFQFRGTQNDYVLKPGNTGVITFKLEAITTEQQGQDYPIPLPKSLNLTNYAIFYHEITNFEDLSKYPGVTFSDNGHGGFTACSTGPAGGGSCIGGGTNPIEAFVTDHPGIDILFEPPSEVLPLDMNATSQVVTMTITADSNAPRGTYLVILPSSGADSFLLTVGDKPYHE